MEVATVEDLVVEVMGVVVPVVATGVVRVEAAMEVEMVKEAKEVVMEDHQIFRQRSNVHNAEPSKQCKSNCA